MITISIVSHGHAELVEGLLEDISHCPEISHLVLTYNIPEREITIPQALQDRLTLLHNIEPKGFGANHNAAFTYCTSPFFCVINPDVRFSMNPFPALLSCMGKPDVALSAPSVSNPAGIIEDSARYFPTLLSLTCRILHISDGRYIFDQKNAPFSPDWVAGMFLLLRSADFTAIKGFDERFFLYYEDVDLCARLWKSGRRVLLCPSVSIIHDARRASHRNLQHFSWHVASLVRYFAKYFTQAVSIKSIR